MSGIMPMGSGEVGEKDCFWKHLGLSLNNHNTKTRRQLIKYTYFPFDSEG